jgi:hypothetical protein
MNKTIFIIFAGALLTIAAGGAVSAWAQDLGPAGTNNTPPLSNQETNLFMNTGVPGNNNPGGTGTGPGSTGWGLNGGEIFG